ncbi:MAG: HAMP domain-containing histidine kinase [Defluviitaleaceae bacterium]|nr:HAMP domain-containing histidine kinase [Defluviitaleaceae bacterium]
MEKIPLEDFEFVIRELKQFVKENIETTEQAKHRHKNISEIMDSMEDGIIFLNNTYHIILANKSALKIFSIHKYRKNYTFIQLYRNQVVTKALRTLNSSEPKILDIIINKRTIRLTLNIFKNGYTIFTKDVTEKLNLEKFQNETITNVSHFLKTPITSIVGFSELVSKKMITDLDKIVEYNQKIYDSGQVLIKLIEDTIILESIEKEDKNDVEEIEITSIVGEVISIYHNQIEEKNIVINVKGNATIKINHMHILYLISNLIENAIKYNIVDGKINIEINKIDNIILTIEDTGIGIEKENLDIIFNRYYRVKNEIKGNGLGLSIVDSIAKIYNIDINIESELYIGSKFIVTFLN